MTDGPRDRTVGDPEPTRDVDGIVEYDKEVWVEVAFPTSLITVTFNND